MGDPLLSQTLDVFASTPAALRSLLAHLPDAVTSAAGDEGWSPKDVVAHLLSLNGPTLLDRIRPILERDEPAIPSVDEMATLEASGLRLLPLQVLLDDFARVRADAVAWLRGLPPDAFSRAGLHSVAGRVTVADLVHHKAWHDLLHVQQVCRMLAGPLDERRGAMRMFS